MSYRLGIDLGTTATAAAFGDGGDISVLSLGHASLSIPSVAAVDADGALLFGDEAAHRLSSSPTSGVREFKRRFGDPIPALVDGVPQPAEDLMAGLFRHVLARVEEQRGEQPESITVTHPANWGEYKRQLLTDSLRACTDVPLTLLAEPEAAAQHYALQERVPAGTLIAVYDLGGGTLDTAVLQKTVDGWTRLGPALGVDQLGGVDFDDLVVTHVRRHLGLGDDVALDPDPAVQSALSQLRHDCRSAKEVLSSRTSADVASLVPGHVGQIRITRSEFEEMARPLITQSVEVLADTIAAANLEPRQVDRILLVGGSSRVPLVSEIIANRLGIPVSIDVHSKHAVSLGAAAGDRPEVSSVVPQSRPTLDDASSASGAVQPNSVSEPQPLRLERHGSPAQRNRRGVIAALAIGVAAIAAVAAFVVTRGGGDAPEAAPGAEGGDDVEPVVAGSPASSDAAVTGTLVGSLGTPGQTNVHPVAGLLGRRPRHGA